MQRQRGELVPIGDALSGMGGPVQALRPNRPPQRGFTLADQVNQLIGASEADPDLGFMARPDGALFAAAQQPRQSISVCPAQRPPTSSSCRPPGITSSPSGICRA